MKERPILFSTPMVRAILEGRKSQTRRIIKPQPESIDHKNHKLIPYNGSEEFLQRNLKCPYGKPSDILWLRETWQHTKCLNINSEDENYGYVYKADGQPWEDYEGWKWKPSIFMPKAASRLKLKVTDIRVERVQDITEEDAIAEGINEDHFETAVNLYNYCGAGYTDHMPPAKYTYMQLWESINGKDSWKSNPWVWVIEFEKL